MKMATTALVVCAFFFSIIAKSEEARPGKILLLDRCPGDVLDPTAAKDRNEALALALLTPLLTGIINRGLKSWGEHLTEAAREAQVDYMGAGGEFYTLRDSKGKEVAPSHACLIVISKGTASGKNRLVDLFADYRSAILSKDFPVTSPEFNKWKSEGPQSLAAELAKYGYTDKERPGIVCVIDVEASVQNADFRLVPRFVVMDHSVRERKVDAKKRDITLEFLFRSPALSTPIGSATIKFDGLMIGRSRLRTIAGESRSRSDSFWMSPSPWMAMPPLPSTIESRMNKVAEADERVKIEKQAWEFALAAAKHLGVSELPEACPALGESADGWRDAEGRLLVEQVKPKDKQSATVLAQQTQKVSYYSACHRMRLAQNDSDKFEFAVGKREFLAFDVSVAVKEFRQRPATAFFGAVLSDDSVRSGLTSAAIEHLDPGTRRAARREDAKADSVARVAYETARLDAEKAILAYNNASKEEVAEAYLNMEYKKRAANRLADELGIDRPYPISGIWFGIYFDISRNPGYA